MAECTGCRAGMPPFRLGTSQPLEAPLGIWRGRPRERARHGQVAARKLGENASALSSLLVHSLRGEWSGMC